MIPSLRRALPIALLAAVVLAATSHLHGYTLSGRKWAIATVLYYVNPKSIWVSPSAAISAVQQAATAWTLQSKANIALQVCGHDERFGGEAQLQERSVFPQRVEWLRCRRDFLLVQQQEQLPRHRYRVLRRRLQVFRRFRVFARCLRGKRRHARIRPCVRVAALECQWRHHAIVNAWLLRSITAVARDRRHHGD